MGGNSFCPHCGGRLGVECFNVEECGWISQQMQQQDQQQPYETDRFGFRNDGFTELWLRLRDQLGLSRRKARKEAWRLYTADDAAREGKR